MDNFLFKVKLAAALAHQMLRSSEVTYGELYNGASCERQVISRKKFSTVYICRYSVAICGICVPLARGYARFVLLLTQVSS